MTALPQLDVTMSVQAQLRTPPRSPVRSYCGTESSTSPEAGGERFTDWVPGMLSPAGSAGDTGIHFDTDAEVEAQLLASPLSKRLGVSPKGQMVIGLEDALPEWTLEKEEDEEETIDVSKLEDEYWMYKQETQDQNLGSA